MAGVLRPILRPVRPLRPLTRAITEAGVGGGFSPASLFASGEAGAWYEVSPQNCFQLSNGTTAAAVGDPVGWLRDLSGNSNHSIQATAANRPILRQDGNGKYYLEFDGTNDALLKAFALTQPFERIAAFRQISWTASDLIFDGGTGANLYQWVATPRLYSYNNGSLLTLDTAPVGQNVCTYELFNGASSRFATSDDFWRVANNGPNNASRWNIGAGSGNIAFYGGIMRAGAMTLDQIRNSQLYFADLANITFWTQSEADEMVIVAGQSNALSTGTTGQPIPAEISGIDSARVKIWDGSAFVGYVAGTNSEPTGAAPTNWGPEAKYAVEWLANHPSGTLYIVKRAVGATDLGTWIPGAGNWNSLATWLYAAKAVLSTTPHVTRALWAQGESDAVNLGTADLYASRLPLLIEGMRYQFGARQIAVMRISSNSPSLTYAATVRAAQASVCAAYDYAHLINTDDLSFTDGLHYNVAGVQAIGERMYDAIVARVGIED